MARSLRSGAAVVLALSACGTSAKGYLTSLQHYPTTDAKVRGLPRPSSGLPRGLVLHWGASEFVWGAEELALHQDGTLYYYYDPAEGSGGRSVDIVASYSLEDIEKLGRVMESHGFCQLESRRNHSSDEGKPRLAVRIGRIDCAVSLWDDEWLELPAAAAIAAALRPLMDATR